MFRTGIRICTIRTMAIAFAAVLSASGLATAQELSTTTSEFTATLVGEVSGPELAVSEANRQALEGEQYAPPVEQPLHRLPDGSLTSEPSQATLDALPWISEPNAATRSAGAFSPSFT